MSEEQRLVRMGWPLEDAVTFCHAKRKEGGLSAFVERLEAEERERARYDLVCRAAAWEVLA